MGLQFWREDRVIDRNLKGISLKMGVKPEKK